MQCCTNQAENKARILQHLSYIYLSNEHAVACALHIGSGAHFQAKYR